MVPDSAKDLRTRIGLTKRSPFGSLPLRPELTVASNLERFQNYSQATSHNRAPHINTYILNFQNR